MTEVQISQCPLFATLDPSECRLISEMMSACCYEAGESIIREGEETTSLYLITTGECLVTKQSSNGHSHELDTLPPGTVFGEISFFCPGPHSATVVATSRVTIFSLSRDRFLELEIERPAAALKITKHATATLAERLRRMDKWTCELVENASTPDHHREWHQFRSQLYSEWNF
ncbi:cAMP receptor protein [Polystyrenella longa]|uniref:cAMP receptor protein n=1 Tax=Polystyrenella longa TaxID=2528007 RepID=A0A518CMB6_9PLAN|nr:cyclic nucleotide-binding domain-containing protein [Polystyrenella longa]QDU80324.1 cAMP receptor protein [Polystyrenella longa]